MKRASTLSRAVRVMPAVLYGSSIFYGGVIDIGRLPQTPGVSPDKLLHALVFLGFEWALELALLELEPRLRRWLSVVVACLVGIGLELVQAALPHRSAELWDFVADALGALLGAALLGLAGRLFSARQRLSERGS